MRKDVKRSLILWPSTATAVVALIAGYSIIRDFSQNIGPDTESLALATLPSFDFAAAITDIEISSRGEHGRRAMELPRRVANVLGVSADGGRDQPQRSDIHLPLWGIEIDSAPEILSGIAPERTEQIASAPIASALIDEITESQNLERAATDATSVLDDILKLNPPASVLPKSNRSLAKPEFLQPDSESRILDSQLDLAAPGLAARKAPIESDKATFRVVGWPTTSLLNEQLEQLTALAAGKGQTRHDQLVSASSSSNGVDQWVKEVAATLQQLQNLPRLGNDEAIALIDRLEALAAQGETQAEDLSDRRIQIQWLQATHGLSRRVAVWRPVWELANANSRSQQRSKFAIAMKPFGFGSIPSAIERVRAILPESGDAAGWDQYLLLNELAEAAKSDDQQRRIALARQFLSRLQRKELHPAHQQWLQREEISALKNAIQPWASGVVDYADLLSQIERQEATSADQAATEIATAMQTLRFADNYSAADVAESIETHYRNANVRVAISQSMLQRLIPKVPPQSVPVRTNMLGSRVRGTSNIQSELQISLVPTPDRWSIQLQTVGQVQTNATGDRGPVAVRTKGNSSFLATTPVEISLLGIDVGQSIAKVRGQTTLRGIQTDYDGWPLVGSLVRSAAARRFDSMSFKSSQISNRKIAAELETKVNDELNQRINEVTEKLTRAVWQPLNRLQLDPIVADMQTTDDRLIARYRLAGMTQLAAFTPRPRAFNTSLLSIQVHQSAINNALEQLTPTDQPMLIRDAIKHTIHHFHDGSVLIPDDIPDDVKIQFSKSNPISTEFKDDSMWVTLRIVKFQRGDRLNLTKFIVQAVYRPEVDGVTARLVRDGHLRISGPGMSMRERLPIRAIFNKVLSPSRSLPLTTPTLATNPAMEGLVISQLDMRDGWIAIAIGEPQADRVASIETQVE